MSSDDKKKLFLLLPWVRVSGDVAKTLRVLVYYVLYLMFLILGPLITCYCGVS